MTSKLMQKSVNEWGEERVGGRGNCGGGRSVVLCLLLVRLWCLYRSHKQKAGKCAQFKGGVSGMDFCCIM